LPIADLIKPQIALIFAKKVIISGNLNADNIDGKRFQKALALTIAEYGG
jgi:hypothetical protein